MTDGPFDKHRTSPAPHAGPVEDLAGKAMSVLLSKRGSGRRLLSDAFLERMERAAASTERDGLRLVIDDMVNSGIPAHRICEAYIPVVARRLGAQWCQDSLGFSDVTIGVSRLQLALRELSRDWRDAPHDAASVAIIVPLEEDHTLGAIVLAGHLGRLGISVRLILGKSRKDVQAILSREPYDAVLVSISHTEKLGVAQALVTAARAVIGRETPVLVGGAALDPVGCEIGTCFPFHVFDQVERGACRHWSRN
ncbi:MAG: cobalamin-dependent protein, partial [Pseudomonadota bacterium]